MKHIFKTLLILMLTSLNLLFASSSLQFTEQEKEYIKNHTTIKIGSIDSYTPFSFLKNGEKIGFTQDLIEIISQKSGLKFEKVGGTWPEVFNKFKNGEIEVITEYSYKDERLEFSEYTNPYFEIPIGVFVRKDFDDYKSMQSLLGKKVGIVKDSYLSSIVKNIKGIEIIELESTDNRFYKLIKGEVDAVLSNAMTLFRIESLMLNQKVKLAGNFEYDNLKKEDLRFGITKNDPVLASIINKTLDSISYSQMTGLKQKWIFNTNEEKEILNLKELIWVDNNSVKIGIEDAKPYIFYNYAQNDIDGLYADILKQVIKRTKLKVEYIRGNWNRLLEMYNNKEIDLLPATFYSQDREKIGYFSEPYYKVREYIYINDNNQSINSLNDLEYKNIAIVKGYGTIKKIKEKIPSVNIIETNSLSESVSMLLNNKIDALIDYHLVVDNYINENSIVGLKGIAQGDLEATSVHYLSQVDKPILKDVLQKGLNDITREEKTHILRQWVQTPYELKDNEFELTTKEKLFIKKHPKIKFRVRANKPPFEFDDNGIPSGIAVDYVKKSANNMGLEVEFVLSEDTTNISYEEISNGREKYDTLLYSVKNKKREEMFSFGASYLSYPMMIVTNKHAPYITGLKDLNGKTVILEEGYLTNEWIKRDYPQINIVNVKNTKEALKKVNSKESLVYVGNLGVANYMMLFEGMDNLKIAAPSGYKNVELSFIAPKQWPELTSILSKGFYKITPTEHSAIQQKWFSLQTIEKVNNELIWKVLIVFLIIILWVVWWNRKITIEKNKTKKALQKLQESQEEQLKQQQIIFNQAKIADMGEMVGNIAHQWRQPLSVISTLATGTKLKKEFNDLSDEEFNANMDAINSNAQHLSRTIDIFRNFLKENKDLKEVILQDRIKLALEVYGTGLKNYNIKLIDNSSKYEPVRIKLVVGELSQVVGNILNNAKDILLEKRVENPWIKIDLEFSEKNVTITIEDNGGGIPESIFPKIFDPYFTTKHSAQGTGLGLHMSYRIMTESLGGNLYAKNSKNGAKFYIVLPKDRD